MNEKWIGEETNTSGSYLRVKDYEELQKRHGGGMNATPLYLFKDRFGNEFYITDQEIITKIQELASQEEYTPEMYAYLYKMVIEKIGVMNYLHTVALKIERERNIGYVNGVARIQSDFRELLGLK